MKCQFCKFDYPKDLLSNFYTSTSDETPLICGICALKETNKIHGANRKKFNGTQAEKMRLAAIKYRKEHSNKETI
jgi:hypothetical protein